MDPTLTPHATRAQTPFERVRTISARSGLDLDRVNPAILDRMRLLAEITETVRDCEHAAELAEQIFRYYDVCKPLEHFTVLERSTVVIGSLFSDIGKSGPADASADGQRLVAEMFAVEHVLDGTVSASAFFDTYFPADASSRVQRFHALGLDPTMHMRAFWDLHSVWTLQILRGDGVPPQAVAAAATHHLLENVNPHAMFGTDSRLARYVGDSASLGRSEKLVILLDKYDAARRRGQRAHDETISWLHHVIEAHPRFRHDQEFLSLIDDLDAVIGAGRHPRRDTRASV